MKEIIYCSNSYLFCPKCRYSEHLTKICRSGKYLCKCGTQYTAEEAIEMASSYLKKLLKEGKENKIIYAHHFFTCKTCKKSISVNNIAQLKKFVCNCGNTYTIEDCLNAIELLQTEDAYEN